MIVLKQFLRNESGATAIEYALITAVNLLGSQSQTTFTTITTDLQTAGK
jgi:Flp pilus assembly pilin Flp